MKQSVFVQHSGAVCDFSSSDSWVILSPIEQSINQAEDRSRRNTFEGLGYSNQLWNKDRL